MNRRQVLQVVGGGVIAAACAPARDPATAWTDPGAHETDPRRRALAWGILAPNPHNMQPWMVDLRTPGEATLHVAQDRLLPQTDPFNRQIVIGCGAFCELTRMAAAHEGWRVDMTPFPVGGPEPRLDARPIAHMRFTRPTAQTDPLFSAVLERRTNRSPFQARAVEPRLAQRVAAAARRPGVDADSTIEPARVAKLKAIAFEGARVESYTPAAHRESMERTFFGAADIAAHPYGVSIRGPMPEFAHAVGLLDQKAMQKHGSFGFNQSLKMLKSGAETAQGFVWLTTPDNTRIAQFEAGRAYVRANLEATALGLAMQPWSQCLQEYATMAPSLRAVHAEVAPDGGRVQMFVRVGYPTAPAARAPKRGLDAQIMQA